MSCEECDKIQDLTFDKNKPESSPIAYYRIDIANIAIIGCPKHVKMTIDKLNSETSHNNDFKKVCPHKHLRDIPDENYNRYCLDCNKWINPEELGKAS